MRKLLLFCYVFLVWLLICLFLLVQQLETDMLFVYTKLAAKKQLAENSLVGLWQVLGLGCLRGSVLDFVGRGYT